VKRAFACLAVALAVVLGANGCHYGYPHACDKHGGIRSVIKSVYICEDGKHVGAGWLMLHHRTVAP
jgi:hypothetical protein